MKLMIVDDDDRVRQLIRAIVFELSADISECTDGSEAAALYAEHLPDWVLMDLMMPGMGGIAATRLITRSHPQARIIIVTSHDSAAIREQAKAAGAIGYILKDNLLELCSMLGAVS